MNLNERRPSLKVSPDQFPYSDDPVKAALEYALRHGTEFAPVLPDDGLVSLEEFRKAWDESK